MAQTVSIPLPAAQASFTDLYRATVGDVFAYVASLVGDRSVAEDVVALAYERAYARRRSFDRRRGGERAWLFGIARNAALDELRRRKRTAALLTEPADDAAIAGEVTSYDEVLTRETLRAALATLEPRERELVVLKFHGGLTHGELARVLRTSESNIGTRLHRAMTRLREACDA